MQRVVISGFGQYLTRLLSCSIYWKVEIISGCRKSPDLEQIGLSNI